MKIRAVLVAAALTMTSSLAFAQNYEPAPTGSNADRGNGAVINRGPVPMVGEDLDYQTNRSRTTVGQAPFENRTMRGDRMRPEQFSPDADQDAPAGH
jgi:hypothetical protein